MFETNNQKPEKETWKPILILFGFYRKKIVVPPVTMLIFK